MSKVTFPRVSASAGVDASLEASGYLFGKPGANFAVICLQEWWGINDEIKDLAATYAEKLGCLVLVPDLYRGKVALEVAEAQHLMDELNWPGALADIDSSAHYLKTLPSVGKVGIVGFCMGGALSLLSAASIKAIAASVFFYGIPGGLNAADIRIPVQGHFGELDGMKGFSDPEAAEALELSLQKAWVPFEMYQYEKVGHAFMNKQEGWYKDMSEKMGIPPFSKEAVDSAWERSTSFFKRHLA